MYKLTCNLLRVFSHFSTLSVIRIKVFLEVSYITHPPTPFIMMLAAYFKTVDLALETFVKTSNGECIGFTANRAIIFARFH